MDTPLENETLNIYKTEVEALLQRNEKYQTLGPAEYTAVVRAFEFTLAHGRERVRAQMLYDMLHENREDSNAT